MCLERWTTDVFRDDNVLVCLKRWTTDVFREVDD